MQPDSETTRNDHRTRPRPSPLLRMAEGAGLVLILYGLARMRLLPALAGGTLVLGAYWLYRQRHGRAQTPATPGDISLGDEGGSD